MIDCRLSRFPVKAMLHVVFLVALISWLAGFALALALEKRLVIPVIRWRRRHEDETGDGSP